MVRYEMQRRPSSSRGPTRFDLQAKPDLVAPGVNVVSLAVRGSRLFNEFEDLRVPGATGQPEYFSLSGTSMASPAVAGAAALLLRENHALPVHALKISLQVTARLVPLTDVLTQGAAATMALQACSLELIDEQLATCVVQAAAAGGPEGDA